MDGFTMYLITVAFLCWLVQEPIKIAPHPQPVAVELKATAILLPDEEGKKTGIVIQSMGQETSVTEPYQGVELKGGKIESKTFTAGEMLRQFPDVMQALPEKPRSFRLNFEANGTGLTQESAILIEDIQQEIAKRAAPEITVVGHTDRQGSDEANLRLSQKRAESIRDILVSKGVPPEIIQTIGRGELEPLIETPDEIVEPRNRRVEITIR
jgi:outer membrane protein OmpA-like peptidoglycan-associated protein